MNALRSIKSWRSHKVDVDLSSNSTTGSTAVLLQPLREEDEREEAREVLVPAADEGSGKWDTLDSQKQFVEQLTSRLEALAAVQREEVISQVGVPETSGSSDKDRGYEKELKGPPHLNFLALVPGLLNAKEKVKKKRKKKDKDDARLPSHMVTIPSRTHHCDPFSPSYSPENSCVKQLFDAPLGVLPTRPDESPLLDSSEILRNLDKRGEERSLDQIEDLSKLEKEKMRKRVRESIVKRTQPFFGASSLIEEPCEFKQANSNLKKSWTRRENTYDPWATGVFLEESQWRIESPREVRKILAVLQGVDSHELDAEDEVQQSNDGNKFELFHPTLRHVMVALAVEDLESSDAASMLGTHSLSHLSCSEPTQTRQVEADSDSHSENTEYDNENGTVDNDNIEQLQRLSTSSPRSPMLAAYSPTYTPKYSPRGYLKFVDKKFGSPAFEQGMVSRSVYEFVCNDVKLDSDDYSSSIINAPTTLDGADSPRADAESPLVISVPTSQVWNSRPYPHHLVALLEGRTWPHSKSAEAIWDEIVLDIISDLAPLEYEEELEFARIRAEEEKAEADRLERERQEELNRTNTLLGGATKSLKQLAKSVGKLGRMFGFSSKDSEKSVVKPAEEEFGDDFDEEASIRRRRLLDFGSPDVDE